MKCANSRQDKHFSLGGIVKRNESCAWDGSECLLFFAVSVFDVVVSPRFLVPGEESASAAPCLPKFAGHAHSPAQVRGPCRYARVLPRGDGVGPTKDRAQYAYIFH